ncbi:MAG TPA: ATP synthase F0 subunit B [Candidatus Limnocylindria bacterium]|nr:ATP synthase F0 subunit B [Candidatus Limnocylindria bacterium]
MTRFLRALSSLVMLMLLAALPALAQEGEASPVDSPAGWIFRWLNFAIVFGAIGYLAWKKGGPYFRAQAEEISRKIAEGARAREAAERQRQEVQAKLANIESEIATIRADSKRDAEAEAQRLRSLAREEAQKIERAAQAEIAAAERASRMELKSLAARMAVERAEALLRNELTPKSEAALFQTFVQELERSVN